MTSQTNKQGALWKRAEPARPVPNRGAHVFMPTEVSDLERIENDPHGSIELAAATLSAKFKALLDAAVHARPDITQRKIADRLRVSVGRVSQVLSGDENPRVTTLARYLKVLGYEVELHLNSTDNAAPAIDIWRSNSRHPIATSRVYVSVVTDGEVTAPAFSIVSDMMSDEHTTLTPHVYVGDVEPFHDGFRVKPARASVNALIAGYDSAPWEVFK